MSTSVEIVFPNIQTARAFIYWMQIHGQEYYANDMEDNCSERVNEFSFMPEHRIIYTQKTDTCSDES